MKRRSFITLLGGAAAAWPMVARAQQAMPVIGFLHSGRSQSFGKLVEAFNVGLSEVGYTDGKNVLIEYRWADDEHDRLPALAAELVARRVSVIAAIGAIASPLAAKGAATATPIVFTTANDPVATGLVASLNRPGGNVTGVARLTTEIVSKRQGLLREIVPEAKKVAWLANPTSATSTAERPYVESAARTLKQRIEIVYARTDNDIDAAFEAIARQKGEALFVSTDVFFLSRRGRIVALAAEHRVPTIYVAREYPFAGGLMSYGSSLADAWRLVGNYVGRILRGEKPADLPVLQPTKFELVVNLKTAKALGVTIPPGVLAIADEVIE